jgi:hypothetical protein
LSLGGSRHGGALRLAGAGGRKKMYPRGIAY